MSFPVTLTSMCRHHYSELVSVIRVILDSILKLIFFITTDNYNNKQYNMVIRDMLLYIKGISGDTCLCCVAINYCGEGNVRHTR